MNSITKKDDNAMTNASVLKEKRIIKSALLAFISSVALCLRLDIYSLADLQESAKIENMHAWFRFVWDLRMSMSGRQLTGLMMFLSLTILFIYSSRISIDKRGRKAGVVLSLIYAFFYVFGESFKRYESWKGVFGSLRNICKASLIYCGFAILSYAVLIILFHLIDRLKGTDTESDKYRQPFCQSNLKLFIIFFFIIVLFWMPYAYAYYPGLSNYDFFDMLDTFYGNDTNSLRVVVPISESVTLNNNNPVLQVLIAVGVMKIGNALGSPYYGIALFCYLQMILFAGTLAYSLVFLNKKKVSARLIVAVLIIYCLLPWNPNFALTTLKDTNYSFMSLLYVMLLAEMITDTDNFFSNRKQMIAIAVVSLIMMLLRNNGVYVLLLLNIIVLLGLRKHWKEIILIGFVPCLVYIVIITHTIYPALGISPGSRAEMYSLPFQQIARVIKEKGDTIEEEDRKAISNVLNDYDKLARRYNPQLADPVKSRFNKYASSEDMGAFVKVWAKYLIKYPGIYVQAAICDCFGYFYPEAEHWLVYTQIEPPGESYGLKSPEDRASMRKELNQMAYIVNRLPGIGLLMSVGFYSWVMFAAVGYLIYSNSKKHIFLWAPNLILLLTVIAGPANTMPRYVYPIIITTPLLICMTISKCCSKESQ